MKSQPAPGIHRIRPKVLFQQIETRYPDENVGFKVNIPSSAIGGMTLLESSILVSLCKLYRPQALFEFGTYLGATSLLLAENTPQEARVVTLDIPANDPAAQVTGALDVLGSDTDNDTFLRKTFLDKGAVCIERAEPAIRARITRLFQDSRTLDPQAQGLAGRFDFIFIDGGHDLETVAIDTRNALAMARPNAVIAWHDFDSKIHGDVTTFLQGYSAQHAVYHVEHSMIAFQLLGAHAGTL